MEYNEFAETTQRLCDLYSKNLNETQVEFWYMSLKLYDHTTYKRAIGSYAKRNKYMPTISDILDEIHRLKSREAVEVKPQVEKVPCEKCHGAGLIKYIKDGYDYLCTCNCKNGRSLNLPILKTWDEVFPHVENSMILNYDLESINF